MQTPEIAADRDTGGADWRGIDENGSNGLSGVSSVSARWSARGWEAGGELGEIGARPYYHQSHKNAVSAQTMYHDLGGALPDLYERHGHRRC